MMNRLPPFSTAPRWLALPFAVATLLAALGAAQAQVYVRPFYYGGTWSGPVAVPDMQTPRLEDSARLSNRELFEEIRDQGLRPLSIIGRGRDTVIVEALSPNDRRMRLTVDAYDGEIITRQLLATARAEPPRAPYVRDVPTQEPPLPPRRKSEKAAPRPAPANPQALNPNTSNQPAATPSETPKTGPVAPARDPSQWGKTG